MVHFYDIFRCRNNREFLGDALFVCNKQVFVLSSMKIASLPNTCHVYYSHFLFLKCRWLGAVMLAHVLYV